MRHRGRAGRLAQLVAVAGMLLGLVVVPASVAAACSCASATPEEVAARNAVVLTGTLDDVDDPGGNYSPRPVAWTVSVTHVHKGRVTATAHILAQDGCGPPAPTRGRLQVFAASVVDGRLVLDACQGVDDPETETGRAVLAAAGSASAPARDGSDLPGSAEIELGPRGGWWASPSGMVLVGLLGLLVLCVGGVGLAVLLGLLVGSRRGRRRSSPARAEPDSTGTLFK